MLRGFLHTLHTLQTLDASAGVCSGLRVPLTAVTVTRFSFSATHNEVQ